MPNNQNSNGFKWINFAGGGNSGGKSWSEAFGSNGSADATAQWNAFKARIAKGGKKFIIIFCIIAAIVLAFSYWWFHPSLSIQSEDVWGPITFVALVALVVFWLQKRLYKGKAAKEDIAQVKHAKKYKLYKKLFYIPAAIILIWLLGSLLSTSLFPGNAEKYASILKTTDGVFAEDIAEVNYAEIPVIDKASAELLGSRTMGSMIDYVSQFEIASTYSQINYQGGPVRVSPLNYADFFKWFANSGSGIPAYVLVNMTTQQTDIVRLDEPIRFSESDPFFNNIDRHVQLSYPFYIFDEKAFEIDEDGKPWWIFPVQSRTIGLFGGTTIKSIILVNASTGECQEIAINQVPQWIDRAYPSNLLIEQYNWSGALSDGWINSWLGQQGVKKTTPGTNGGAGYNYIAKDDDVWLYTGVTSATADDSIIGCILINQRTGESRFYSVAGATEDSAMRSAEGQVQNLRYEATFPLLLNINSQPTFFMALKDSAGLVKKYAMLDVQRYQNVAVGDTVADTQKTYKTLLATNGILTNPGSGGDQSSGAGDLIIETSGRIKTIYQVSIEGNSHVYFTLEGDQRIYDCLLPALIEVVRFSVGDLVTVTAYEGDILCVVESVTAG